MFDQFRNYKKSYFSNDLISGITVAALTIPVTMGYAQIAGLPPVYGLYGSILPVIAYALFASSPQLIFGVDASAAAVAGSLLATAGIAANSKEAIAFIPAIALFTGVFMLLFAFFKLDKLTVYVSESVMSGAIFGISLSIMFSQITKILGIKSEGSEFPDTLRSLFDYGKTTNFYSLSIGVIVIALILTGKKLFPKIPIPLIVLIGATVLSAVLNLQQYDVTILGEIPKGFPPIKIPSFGNFSQIFLMVGGGLLSSIILTTDSLLVSKNFADKNHYKLNGNQELKAFGIANVVAAFSGFLPNSASVSRTAANEQFKGKSQVVSIISAIIVLLILLFFSAYLYDMPQPALSGIVFAALWGVLVSELKTYKELTENSESERVIWIAAMFFVLFFGILSGIVIGILLSFILNIVTKTTAASAFLGRKPNNKELFYDVHRNKEAQEIPHAVIYRYTNSLFFTNIEQFILELKQKISSDTQVVIVEAHGIATIDTTSANKLREFLLDLEEKKIPYYFVSTIGDLRDVIQQRELTDVLPPAVLLRTIEEALAKVNIESA